MNKASSESGHEHDSKTKSYSRRRRFARAGETESIDNPGRFNTSQPNKRAAIATLAVLTLTTGEVGAMIDVTANDSNISAGRLAIRLANHNEYKTDSCTNESRDNATNNQVDNDDQYNNLFAANSNNDNPLPNPFISNPQPITIIEFVDILDVIEMINNNLPVELETMNNGDRDY